MNDDTVLALQNCTRLQWESSQNCHVLLYPEGLVRLNDSAHAILKFVDGRRTLKEILSAVEEEFAGEKMHDELIDFVESFYKGGWLRYV